MSTSLTLYELSENLTALLDSLAMCETPEDRAQCEAEIQAAAEQQIRKVDSFCAFLAHCESQITLATAEVKRLQERKAAMGNVVERLEGYAVRLLQSQGLAKLEGDTSTLSLRQCPPAVEISDADKLPAEFVVVKQTTTPDKMAIKKAIKAGRDVPGADLTYGDVVLVRK